MKNIVLTLMFLFSLVSLAYADANSEDNDHWEKVRQLDQLAERFKAETGFTGQVDRDNQRVCLCYIRGNFPDVSFPDHADTLAMRRTFDAIIEKIIPYLGFEGLALTKTRIGYNTTGASTIYRQLVHGYSFEHVGEIIIGYSRNSDDITISNAIVYKPIPPIHVNYTFTQAVEIARQHYINVLGYPDTLSFEDTKGNAQEGFFSIRLNKIRNNGTKYVYDKGEYRLCHIFGISVSFGQARVRAAYIDAQTGEIVKLYDDGVDFTNCLGQSQVYSIEAEPTTIDLPLPNICVINNNVELAYYTDQEGICMIDDEPINPEIVSFMISKDNIDPTDPGEIDYKLALYGSTQIRRSNSRDLTANPITLYYDDDESHSPNVYYHLLKQHIGLLRFSESFSPDSLTVFPGWNGATYGRYYPNSNQIFINNEKGEYSHIIRHELDHAYIQKTLGRPLGNDNVGTVEEALADYLACSISNTPSIEYGVSNPYNNIENIPVNQLISAFGWTCFEEEFFNIDRRFSYPIASALWCVRDSLGIHDDGYHKVDDLIDESLNNEIRPDQSSYDEGLSACPRYLFNNLMNRAGNSSRSWQLNPTQAAIRNGFHSRGLYFLPNVISTVDDYSDEVNLFSPGTVVHAKVSNYIQDSPIDVYIVRHQQDAYTRTSTNGVNISDLPIVLGPIRVYSDMEGVAQLSIIGSESLLPGEYDIIADCGYTYPDSTVYLHFYKRDVLDAIDGLDDPGFVITDWGDAAVALFRRLRLLRRAPARRNKVAFNEKELDMY